MSRPTRTTRIGAWLAGLLALFSIPPLFGAPSAPEARATAQAGSAGKRALTVADAIETTRLMSIPPVWAESAEGELRPIGQGDVTVSPNGKRWAAMLVRGDLERNGNWMELIGGSLDSLEAAARVETVARLFTKSLGTARGAGSSYLTFAHFNPILWLEDNARVAFYFSDGEKPIQVVTVNMRTRQVDRLTNHPEDIVSFALNRDGTLIYSARVPPSPDRWAELLRRGFAVPSANAIAMLRGDVDGYSGLDSETFLVTKTGDPPRRIQSNPRGIDRWTPLFDTQFSPDGRYALIEASPDEVPEDWDRYTDDLFKVSIQESRRDRDGFYARFIKQLFVVDIGRATSRPLWRAPNSTRLRAAWSPDGRSILLGSTYLPTERADAEGLAGRAVAEVEVATGRVSQVPIPPEVSARGIGQVRWRKDGGIEIDDEAAKLRFKKLDGKWQSVTPAEDGQGRTPSAPVRIELRQDLNTPPRLFAVEASTGRDRMILDLNPRLRTDFTLGRVEHVTWADKEGRTWSGLLYYPVNHAPGRRFPLVIQTHGHAPPNVFSLYGTGPGSLALGLGPSYSVFAAQPLANRDIAVLQMEDKTETETLTTPKEPEMYMAAYEAAIEKFASAGLVDRDKVGIVGYSRTGWHVEYALTHSKFSYAAAITSDNLDGSYVQSLLAWTDEYAKNNGAKPFGDGLKVWVERSPGFNADKVRAPLRLQLESGGLSAVMFKWEMFSRLRLLEKPVEFFIIPDIEHGSHGLQNPAQCLAAQQGAVDWFDFWLNGREDPDRAKAEQYRRWRELKRLHTLQQAQARLSGR